MSILGPTPPRLPIGLSDYREVRLRGLTYVDKTSFVASVLDGQAVARLYPRPRRFGKTLNLSTLRYFLERTAEDLTDIFADTAVGQAERHQPHFQRYPVIFLSFKDVKATTWAGAWQVIVRSLKEEVVRLLDLHDLEAQLADTERAELARLASGGPPESYQGLLHQLCRWCTEATGANAVLLIDEYDAPLNASWQHGYWDEALAFFRSFFSGGLKDNPYLFRGVMTGILRVAKEGIFSGLNNLSVSSLLDAHQPADFGFTEHEVEALADACGLPDSVGELRAWYNGYRFGGPKPVTVYNPWSIIQYLDSPQAGPLSYWKNSSANVLVREVLIRHAHEVGPAVQRLIAGESVDTVIDDNVALPDIWTDSNAVWSLLTFSGYLTATTARPSPDGVGHEVSLRIPNREVRGVYIAVFSAFMRQGGNSQRLVTSILAGDEEGVHGDLQDILLTSMSLHDFGRKPVEAIYQAFVIGLLVQLDATHRVVSNREAGYGRADILIIPRQPGPGAVLELKIVTDRETPEHALERAVAQIRDRDYQAEVRAAGATTVHQYGVVFNGKKCWVQQLR